MLAQDTNSVVDRFITDLQGRVLTLDQTRALNIAIDARTRVGDLSLLSSPWQQQRQPDRGAA